MLKKYKVLGEIFPLNEDGSQQENALELGSVQEVPEEVGNGWVDEGLAEEVVPDEEPEEEVKEEEPSEEPKEEEEAEPTKSTEAGLVQPA